MEGENEQGTCFCRAARDLYRSTQSHMCAAPCPGLPHSLSLLQLHTPVPATSSHFASPLRSPQDADFDTFIQRIWPNLGTPGFIFNCQVRHLRTPPAIATHATHTTP